MYVCMYSCVYIVYFIILYIYLCIAVDLPQRPFARGTSFYGRVGGLVLPTFVVTAHTELVYSA